MNPNVIQYQLIQLNTLHHANPTALHLRGFFYVFLLIKLK